MIYYNPKLYTEKFCIHCGISNKDVPFYKRMKRGKMSYSNICIICKRDQQREESIRFNTRNPERRRELNRQARKNTQWDRNAYERKRYMIKKRSNWGEISSVGVDKK